MSWSPHALGRSLPVDERLRPWRRGLAAVAAGVAVVLVVALWFGQRPSVDEPLDPAAADALARGILARVELAPWDPGPPLEATPEPPPPELEPPPPWDEIPPWDRLPGDALGDLSRSRSELEAGQPVRAATLALRAASDAPSAWLPRYQAGLALLAARDPAAAADELERARVRLPETRRDDQRLVAARIATYLALGQALAPDDCLGAIGWFKQAVGTLPTYMEAADVLVYDADLPFTIEPLGRSSHEPWLALIETYARCPAYPERYAGRSKDFRTEYRNPEADAVVRGPFPDELAACIRTSENNRGDAPARCWQISNLNRLAMANRRHLPDPATGAPPEVDPTAAGEPQALARLAESLARALLAADSDAARDRAPTYLDTALAYARRTQDRALEQRIVQLGRHLAPVTGDYSVLAHRFRGRSPESLELTGDTSPEEVKGIAWHLSQRWQRQLAAGDVDVLFDEVTAQRRSAGPHGASLAVWSERSRETLRQALVTEMRQRRDNGDLAGATAIRDLDAPYLGADWESAAAAGWRPWGTWLFWAGVWLLLVLALAALYRLVVVPYALYTTDFYREEFSRRHEASKKARRAFTRREIEARGERA